MYEDHDINEWWNRSNEIMLRIGNEVVGESKGKIMENNEAWWFSEEIQQKTELKKRDKEEV